MAAPRLALAVLVVMLAVITLSEGMRGSGPKRCCTRYTEKEVQQSKVVSYAKTSQRCPKQAIIFRMVGGRTVCARSTTPWVKRLMSNLDANSVHVSETSNL